MQFLLESDMKTEAEVDLPAVFVDSHFVQEDELLSLLLREVGRKDALLRAFPAQ